MTVDVRQRLIDSIGGKLADEGQFMVTSVELIYTPPGPFKRDPLRVFRRSNERDRPMFAKDGTGVERMVGEILQLANATAEAAMSGQPQRFKVNYHSADKVTTWYPFTIAYQPAEGETDADEA